MSKRARLSLLTAVLLCNISTLGAQTAPSSPKFKDEQRMPWQRGDRLYLRQWLVAGPFACGLEADCLGTAGAESAVQPTDGMEQKRADGTSVKWHAQKAWADAVAFDDLAGPKEGAVAYAFTKVSRPKDGKALLLVGSEDGVRVWVNGKPVLARDGIRTLTPDEDQVEVDMKAGENALLVKVSALRSFSARVVEPGTVVARRVEIGPSLVKLSADGFTLKTDIGAERSEAEQVKVEVVRPGGSVIFTAHANRGAEVPVDARNWPDGPYEVRCTTHTFRGLLYAAHLPWYKGDSLAHARELAATAAKADVSQPEGFTLRMLSEMVEDRLGSKLSEAKGNPWLKIHSPLMEFDEMMLERKGQTGRIHPYGFLRLAYRDEVDGSPQYCRVYLPANYDPAKKWPLAIQMHGYNPANPVYVRWWAADSRHPGIDTEFSGNQQVIYMEPHGRGNVTYLGMGDSDVMHAIAEAKRLLSVDDDRVYLTGDSMGGWGTWNISTRHPDLFAAIAPVFGGVDYHSTTSDEAAAKMIPVERFMNEKGSSWSMADGLLNLPILVDHGDVDQSVNVDFSRWGVRLLQRWGYNVRYHEFPGRGHESLETLNQNGNMNIEWFLQHRRDPNPLRVRLRSANLRYASAYWARALQSASPLAFMTVDAEVVDRNAIRLDTENVLDIALTPSAALIDPSKPVKVIWNGVAHELRLQNGELRLTAAGYDPAPVHKNSRLPGSTADFTVTPFAVVVGTASADPEMAAQCRRKADEFAAAWKDWQKQAPRVFLDSEIKDADLAKYSLMLIGGPDANRATARLADRLPLTIAADHITISGKTFPAKDAAVQVLYPNPLNAERYVWISAGTSADGLYFTEVNPQRLSEWDYMIADGHIPGAKESASSLQTRVVSGMFDYNWHYSDALTQPGDSAVRDKGRQMHRPKPNLVVDPKVLDAYVGRYQIEKGPMLEVVRDGAGLKVKVQGQGAGDELTPENETDFDLTKYGVWLSFVRDSTGKVTGFAGYQESSFEAKRLE